MVFWKYQITKQGGNEMQKRILVVDDDSMNLVRTKMIMGKYYDVLFEESGIEALDKLKKEKVDLK